MRHRFCRVCKCLLVVIAVLASAGPVRADLAKANAHFEKGTRLYQVGEYAKALEEFKAGYVEEADPSFLFNTAQCYWRLGKEKEALLGYKRFLSLSPDTPLRTDVENKMRELEEKLRTATPVPAEPEAPTASPVSPTRSQSAASKRAAPKLTQTADAPESPSRWPVWVGGIVTLACAGGATALGLTTNTRYQELRDTCGRTPAGCSDRVIDDISNRGRLVNILAAGAGVAALATGIAFYATSEETGVAVAFKF